MKLPKEWPVTVKQGNASVKIYRATNTKGAKSYHEFKLVFYDTEHKRRFKTFASYERADKKAHEVVATITRGDSETLTLTNSDRLSYLRAVDALRLIPDAHIDDVVREYVAAKRLIGNHTLKEAAAFFARNCVNLHERTVRQVVDELVALREQRTRKGRPASKKYVADLRQRLGKFAGAFQCSISSVTPEKVEAWITELRLEGWTRFNYLRLVKTLFRFAQAKRYFPKDINAMEGIENEFEDDSEIEIFTPEELRRLFASARAELIPYLAIAAFAGLRAAELVRLDWSDVKADYIELKKGKAKTRSRRLIPIQPNLAAWLAHYRQKSGPVTQFANMSKQLLWLAENTAAEGKEDGTPAKPALTWKHNGLRHSFITYRMAIANDENIVASESGNSPDMIYRHYRQLITPEQAKAWFSIVPTPAPA